MYYTYLACIMICFNKFQIPKNKVANTLVQYILKDSLKVTILDNNSLVSK